MSVDNELPTLTIKLVSYCGTTEDKNLCKINGCQVSVN